MKKQVIALLLIAVLSVSLLAGCSNNSPITQEKAQKIALAEAGLTAAQVEDVHVHITTQQGLPCYSVHITTADREFSIVINAANGEVMK